MSGFKHKNGNQPALKDDFRWPQGMEIEEMAQYVDGPTLNKLIASSCVSLKEIPRAGISRYDSDFPGKAFGFIKRKEHPATRKTHQLEAGRRTNEFIRKHERPAKKQPWKLPRKSLHWLAVELEKTSRQVRRYCEQGLVPGAYRTKGGHWRVRCGRRTLVMVQRNIRDFTRKSWTHSERRFSRERAEAETTRRKMNVAKALNQMSGMKPKDAIKAAQREEYRTRLVLATNQIYRAEQPLTAKSIANHLGISRASLYRFFSADAIRASIRVAREPATKANFEDDY
jgi:hypothetical protein